ncbi:hypothetical protein [Bradyrhizobium sp. RDM4]|uniref:hypothetical protein n=1 Tax=Bradyrhizobium sp. RDM4 TaxID=3378765 RepID=UPI0038FCFA5D
MRHKLSRADEARHVFSIDCDRFGSRWLTKYGPQQVDRCGPARGQNEPGKKKMVKYAASPGDAYNKPKAPEGAN